MEKPSNKNHSGKAFNPIRTGLFGAPQIWGGGIRPPSIKSLRVELMTWNLVLIIFVLKPFRKHTMWLPSACYFADVSTFFRQNRENSIFSYKQSFCNLLTIFMVFLSFLSRYRLICWWITCFSQLCSKILYFHIFWEWRHYDVFITPVWRHNDV